MSAHYNSELCAPKTWVTMPEDEKNEILFLTQVQKPSSDDIFDMFKNCIDTTTDERILQLRKEGFIEYGAGSYIAYLMAKSPWEVKCDCEGFYLLYKQWYDTVSTNMGMKPQVTIYSPMKYDGMPEHWIYKHIPHQATWGDDDPDVLQLLYTQGMEGDVPIVIDDEPDDPIEIDDDPDAPIPMDSEVQILRRTSRVHSCGVERLTYDSHGQVNVNTIFF